MSKHPRQGVSGANPADLGWMTGSWKGQHGPDQVEEYWSPFAGGTLMGMLRWQKGGGVFFYEFLAIEDEAMECLLVELRAREAVFLGVNDPGRWVIYRLETDDTLVSYFEKDDGPTFPEEIFVYGRQADGRSQS